MARYSGWGAQGGASRIGLFGAQLDRIFGWGKVQGGCRGRPKLVSGGWRVSRWRGGRNKEQTERSPRGEVKISRSYFFAFSIYCAFRLIKKPKENEEIRTRYFVLPFYVFSDGEYPPWPAFDVSYLGGCPLPTCMTRQHVHNTICCIQTSAVVI